MNTKEKHVYLFSELDQAEAYAKDGWDSVSYTHLTLPTNREV